MEGTWVVKRRKRASPDPANPVDGQSARGLKSGKASRPEPAESSPPADPPARASVSDRQGPESSKRGRPPKKAIPAGIPETIAIIAENFRLARLALNETQDQLAERTGLAQRKISDLERGQVNPTLQSIELFAAAVNITVADLLRPASTSLEPEADWKGRVADAIKK